MMTSVIGIPAIETAINNGDDDLLTFAAWADALEEVGDVRAAAIRRITYRLDKSARTWTRNYPPRQSGWLNGLPGDVFDKLPGDDDRQWDGVCRKTYPTRSAAYLALAEALTRS